MLKKNTATSTISSSSLNYLSWLETPKILYRASVMVVQRTENLSLLANWRLLEFHSIYLIPNKKVSKIFDYTFNLLFFISCVGTKISSSFSKQFDITTPYVFTDDPESQELKSLISANGFDPKHHSNQKLTLAIVSGIVNKQHRFNIE